MKSLMKICFVLLMAGIFLSVSSCALAAYGHRHHGRHYHHRVHHHPHHYYQHRHHGYYHGYRHEKGIPPGWHHGRKTGWHGRGMPPGQAKKW